MIRTYLLQDLEPVVRLWNQALPADKVTPQRLRRHLLEDENFDPQLFLLEEEGADLRGFAVGLVRRVPYHDRGLEEGTGWVYAFGVGPDCRRAGVGTALLAELERRLALRGARRLVLGLYSPGYLMPGLDVRQYPQAAALLAGRGYRLGDGHLSMYRTLFDYTIPEEVAQKQAQALAQGYRFVRCTPDRGGALLDFVGRWFSAGWLHHTRQLLARDDPGLWIWLCLDPQGEVAGFAQRGMGGLDHRFGPFGVRPDCRGQSLGSILLAQMLYDLSCQGMYLTYFMTTDQPGARMYARHGFAVYRRFADCVRPAPGE